MKGDDVAGPDEVTRETSPASAESLQERDHVTRGNPMSVHESTTQIVQAGVRVPFGGVPF